MTRTLRGVAFAIGVLLAVGACSGKNAAPEDAVTTDRPTVEVTAQPQDPQLARVIVEQVFESLSEGDWAGAWELWTDSAKAAIGKQAYIDLIATCAAAQGGSYEVTDVRPVDQATTSVNWKHVRQNGPAVSGSNTVRYEDGAWRFQPDPAALEAYKRGVCA